MSAHAPADSRVREAAAIVDGSRDAEQPDLARVIQALPAATAVFATDAPHYTVLEASDVLLASAGRPRDLAVGRPLAEAFPNASPDDPDAGGLTSLRASIGAAIATGVPQPMARQRYDLRRPDGVWEVRYWDALNTPVRGADGAVRYVLHQTEDVTALVRGEAERAELAAAADVERARTAGVLAAMSDAYVALDAEWRVVAMNAAAERIAGQPAARTLGRTHWEAWPASVGTAVERAYTRAMAERVPVHLEHRYTEPANGAAPALDVWLEVDAVPTPDGGLGLFYRDITARKRAEAERADALAAAEAARARADAERVRAEQANQAKAQFLATMSHELRTPLNAIGGYVQLLEMGLHGPVTEAQRDALARVDRAQRHLLGLINDVLNLSKLEAGKVEYAIEALALADVVADVAPLVEPQLAAKGHAFAVRVPADAPAVWADRDKLRQVLANLLSNAAKFTAPGGRVTLELAERADGTRPGGVAFLRVADTGCGIPGDKQAHIFEPFVQVHAGYARAAEGTGLGLAISRDLARGMGGDLRVRSREGEGAAFTVTLQRVRTAGA